VFDLHAAAVDLARVRSIEVPSAKCRCRHARMNALVSATDSLQQKIAVSEDPLPKIGFP